MADRENAHITMDIGYKKEHVTGGGLSYMMWGRYHPQEARDPVASPNLSLLYVSKQVHAEALRAGWEGLKRCFIDHQIFTAVADSKVGVSQQFNVLGCIQLSFTMKSWLKFFGIEVHDTDTTVTRDVSTSLGRYLGALDEKCNLELRFRDPRDGYHGDPFRYAATTCQTVMTDWVMALAYEQIKYIKNVDLVGHIKTPQRARWLDILAKQHAETDYDFDYATAIQFILATTSDDL